MAPMRVAYHEALERTRLDLTRLGVLVCDALEVAVESLEKRDTTLAARVVAGHDEVEALRSKIEASCIELIWKQQPVAGELQRIAAMLVTIIDLERVGDYAISIAKDAIKLDDEPTCPARVEIDRIGSTALEMLRDALRAFADDDVSLAKSVVARKGEVDALCSRAIEALQQEIAADARVVRAGTIMLFVLRSLERSASRAPNLASHLLRMLGEA